MVKVYNRTSMQSYKYTLLKNRKIIIIIRVRVWVRVRVRVRVRVKE